MSYPLCNTSSKVLENTKQKDLKCVMGSRSIFCIPCVLAMFDLIELSKTGENFILYFPQYELRFICDVLFIQITLKGVKAQTN